MLLEILSINEIWSNLRFLYYETLHSSLPWKYIFNEIFPTIVFIQRELHDKEVIGKCQFLIKKSYFYLWQGRPEYIYLWQGRPEWLECIWIVETVLTTGPDGWCTDRSYADQLCAGQSCVDRLCCSRQGAGPPGWSVRKRSLFCKQFYVEQTYFPHPLPCSTIDD